MPDSKSTIQRLADAARHVEAGRNGDAEKVYWEILQSDPGNTVASLNLASLLFDRGKVDEAATLCRTVEEHEPDLPPLNVIQSRIALVRGQFNRSLELITRAHAGLPTDSHIAAEFVQASRRRYWTVDRENFEPMFEAASSGELDAGMLPRLVHQLFARLLRPRLIAMICGERGASEITDDSEMPLVDQWVEELESEDDRAAVQVFQRNLDQALGVMRSEAAFGPQRAIVRMRDGSVHPTDGLRDVDPLTMGCIELTDAANQTRFISPAHLRRIIFGPVAEATGCAVEYRNGTRLDSLMPLFEFFTTFSPDPEIRTGRKTVLRRVTADLELPLGVRAWWVNGRLVPMMNVGEIEFPGTE